MKRTLRCMLVLLLACVGFAAHAEEKKYFELGVAPVNPKRMVDWTGGEYLLRLAGDEKATITMRGGKTATAWLRAGELVVMSPDGTASWVLRCGNEIIEPKNWRPKGSSIDHGPKELPAERKIDYRVAEERPKWLPREESGGTWTIVDSERAPQKTVKRKDPNKKWYYVAAGVFLLGAAGAYCSSPSGGCWQNGAGGGGSQDPPAPGGGPAPDPPN